MLKAYNGTMVSILLSSGIYEGFPVNVQVFCKLYNESLPQNIINDLKYVCQSVLQKIS